ncbi:MAG: choloylglycine hydrolase family protein [Lachnospiraceae bacterium]|nr:choloylglycine hydrolase family protein [Lachnospiraceae bacterium]
MCTAITYSTKDHYFGRTLDYEISYEESVTITPRKYPFVFRNGKTIAFHYAMIGMAYVKAQYPLYYEATNEKGLSMAGLEFPENAHYQEVLQGKDNIAPFEFISWILSQCADMEEAKKMLGNIQLVNVDFSKELPVSPLHWIIADKTACFTIECVKDGLKIYENPVGILTNNPPFDYQMANLRKGIPFTGKNLPGDLSSESRFLRAAFTKFNSVSGESEMESLTQFFHILGSVEQTRGRGKIVNDKFRHTIYTSCCNMDKGIYYYTSYENNQITGIDMHKENLDGNTLVSYPLLKTQQIRMIN